MYLLLGSPQSALVIRPEPTETVLVFHRRPDNGQPVELDKKTMAGKTERSQPSGLVAMDRKMYRQVKRLSPQRLLLTDRREQFSVSLRRRMILPHVIGEALSGKHPFVNDATAHQSLVQFPFATFPAFDILI